eukprot:Seg557.3 transcript_id=Seg557.3/GoldUCD/mRNA.D3Y31 product="Zinc metalloproteinase nas-6" protein_id=Seg557.3/GoldUCD/D3Y31
MKIFVVLFIVCGFSVAKKHPASRLAVFDQIAKINEKIKSVYETPSNNEEPELFEGDIVWTQSLKNDVNNKAFGADQTLIYSDAISNGAWTGGVIPYSFDVFNAKGQKVVKEAVEEFHENTCIKWVPRKKENDYVSFFHGSGCYSKGGKQGGKQEISLDAAGCLHKVIAMHEMMHCAGFYHEQSRRDRDKYIKIHHSNINDGQLKQFDKYRSGEAATLGMPYDKKSIMHYGNYAFSKNGKKTITSLSNPSELLGNTHAFSKIDIQQLNKYYDCKGKTTTAKKCIDFFIDCPSFKSECDNELIFATCSKTCQNCSPKKSGQKKAKRRKLAKAFSI